MCPSSKDRGKGQALSVNGRHSLVFTHSSQAIWDPQSRCLFTNVKEDAVSSPNERISAYSDQNTTLNAPSLIGSQKLSRVGPGSYSEGRRPRGLSFRCLHRSLGGERLPHRALKPGRERPGAQDLRRRRREFPAGNSRSAGPCDGAGLSRTAPTPFQVLGFKSHSLPSSGRAWSWESGVQTGQRGGTCCPGFSCHLRGQNPRNALASRVWCLRLSRSLLAEILGLPGWGHFTAGAPRMFGK